MRNDARAALSGPRASQKRLGTVLVTGGTGSFGRAFIRYVLAQGLVDRVISVSRNAEMRYRLEQDLHDPRLLVVPGDVRHWDDLEAAYEGPIDLIVHAAAEKHIGTGQTHGHWVAAINVGGAANVARFALQCRVPRVVALSTDKACAPINTYGRSKAEAEHIFTIEAPAAARYANETRYAVVRYGNVVGSSGSVIPLFIRQRESGTVTVTDRRMSRYWMPLSPEADVRVFQEPGGRAALSAVELVLYAVEQMQGGEIFVPRIPSASVQDLAAAIAPGCDIREIGIRDGEKLHEDLIAVDEAERTWETPDGIFVIVAIGGQPPPGSVRVPAGFTYSSDQHLQPVRFQEGQSA